MDPTIRNAIKLVHSSGTDNAEKIRQTLDELIKSRFSSSKMLVNVLSKKHLAEENTAPGSGTQRSHRHRSTDSNSKSSSSKSNSSNSSVSALEVTTIPIDTPIMVELETLDEDTIMEELKELEELVCVVCRQVDVSFKNRLVECADCHSLYHQECHKPQISESDANDQEDSWICVMCKSKEISKEISKPPPIPSPPPHKSSSSSYKSSSKSHESSSKSKSKSSSSSSKSRESSSSGSRESSRDKSSSSSSSSSVTPKINIISADKRIQIMKKKAKLNEGKRKHK
uniref:Integrator complex subunit 12 n=2 Tax=Nyssomyia neivai TaxID=330878 RepID=A0A1L8DCI5_9DIPT